MHVLLFLVLCIIALCVLWAIGVAQWCIAFLGGICAGFFGVMSLVDFFSGLRKLKFGLAFVIGSAIAIVAAIALYHWQPWATVLGALVGLLTLVLWMRKSAKNETKVE